MGASGRQRRTEGAVVEIGLGDGQRAFGRLLREPLIEFYDVAIDERAEVDVDALSRSPVAFTIWVMNSPITNGRWVKVGKVALSDEERQRIYRFAKQDPITKLVSIYWTTVDSTIPQEVEATAADVQGLERAAVWSAEHVEDRLRDHFSGTPNRWVESLRVQVKH